MVFPNPLKRHANPDIASDEQDENRVKTELEQSYAPCSPPRTVFPLDHEFTFCKQPYLNVQSESDSDPPVTVNIEGDGLQIEYKGPSCGFKVLAEGMPWIVSAISQSPVTQDSGLIRAGA